MSRAGALSIAVALACGCAPAELSTRGAAVAVSAAPGAGCARIAEVNASAGYNGRGAEANTAGVEAALRNDAAARGGDAIVIVERTFGAPKVDPLAPPGGTQRGGCPNCVAMRAEVYRCTKAVSTAPKAQTTPSEPRASASGPEPRASASPPDDRFALTAQAALDAASDRARACLTADGPRGEARLRVTFAPTGDVVYAEVEGAPFEGTSTGACIAGKARNAHVPAFQGEARSITRTLKLVP